MTIKIAISLPDDLVEEARRAVAEGRSASVSAFIADAMQQRRRYDGLSELLAEMSADAGPPTDEHRAWARDALGID